jgi:hypothetical protein
VASLTHDFLDVKSVDAVGLVLWILNPVSWAFTTFSCLEEILRFSALISEALLE